MRTTGTTLLAVKRCCSARVWMSAHDSRSAPRLLYPSAVRGGICQAKHCQVALDTLCAGVGTAGSVCPVQPIGADEQLAATRQTGDPRLRAWAHMLGYGGHFLTKSRRYSVTFGQLRTARADHRRTLRHPDGERDPWGRPLDDTTVLILKTWTYDGPGQALITSGAELALASADQAREHGA